MSKSNHLEAWLAQEQVVRSALEAGPGPGVATAQQIAGKTGLEVMQALLRGDCPTRTSPRRWTSP